MSGEMIAGRVEAMYRHELLDILQNIQDYLYWDYEKSCWTLDKEISGGDFVDHVSKLMQAYGLSPEGT